MNLSRNPHIISVSETTDMKTISQSVKSGLAEGATVILTSQLRRIESEPSTFLSADEIANLAKFSHAQRHQQFLQSRYILKQVIANIYQKPMPQIMFELIGEGKPTLHISENYLEIDFSISHLESFLIIAFAQGKKIGIDIERFHLQNGSMDIARKYFSPQEVTVLDQIQDLTLRQNLFLELWCLKEAVIKAAAGGVFRHLHAIECSFTNEHWQLTRLPSQFPPLANWNTSKLNFHNDYLGALALIDSNVRQ